MKTMNGITNELLVRKARKNWKTRCGAFLLAALATLFGHQSVLGQVIIEPSPGNTLGQGWSFAQTPAAGQPGPNAGGPQGANYNWNGPNGDGTYNNLQQLVNGMTVNTVGPNGVTGTWNLYSTDVLRFTGSGQVTFYQNTEWTASRFIVDAGTATINARGGILNLGNMLTNNGRIDLNDNRAGVGVSTNGITVTGGSNAGDINLVNTVMNLNGNLTGNGTIFVGSLGQLNVTTNNVGNNIDAAYTGRANTRGLVSINGSTNLNGYLSGSVALVGGGTARITANNTGVGPNGALSRLTVLENTVARIENQNNIGDVNVRLGSGGTLAKMPTVGNLRITNSINIGVMNDDNELIGTTGGGLSSYIGSGIPWNENADSMHDAGRRFIVAGILSSTFLNSVVSINYDAGGTVVLANVGNTFTGSFDVFNGVLEVSSEGCLGMMANDVNQYSVNLGGSVGASASTYRPTFRVVGTRNTEQTISHAIQLNASDATYEVFTVAQAGITTLDDGATVTGTLDGEVTGTFTGTITDGAATGAVQILDPDITTMADRDRFTVHEVGLITGAYDLNKAGDGVLSLESDKNNYTGDTIIWHGVLRIVSANSINNNEFSRLLIGGNSGYETTGFRPVFETTLGKWEDNKVMINTQVMINQSNSIIRTTGLGNETIINSNIRTEFITGAGGAYAQHDAVLNKDGAGTLTLHGNGEWGPQGAGELVINQGTVQFKAPKNLAKGYITLGTDWNTYKDLEIFDNNDLQKNIPVTYQAILKLEDNSGSVAIGNQIFLATPSDPNNPAVGSYLEVGQESKLTLSAGVSELHVNGSDLNKTGLGELVLNGTANGFTGWTKIHAGTVTTSSTDNLLQSLGVDLIGNNTTFKLESADQTIRNLRGIDPVQSALSPSEWNPDLWTRTVDIGNRKLTVQSTLGDTRGSLGSLVPGNILYGNIIGDGGTLVMDANVNNSSLAAGFVGFKGDFQINSGNIMTLTDTTVDGLSGKAGTKLDIYGKTLTLNIGNDGTYNGAIVSTWSIPLNPKKSDYGEIVKEGVGTLVTNFEAYDSGGSMSSAFNGSVTLKEGGLKLNSNFTMAKGNDMTFYVNTNPDGSVTPLVFDISGHAANFKALTNLNVFIDDTTGWDTPNGRKIIGQIRGNDLSDYSGLTPMEYNSLFYGLGKDEVTAVGRRDLNVVMNVTGLGGLGGTANQSAVGQNLDGIRRTDLSNNTPMADILKKIWAKGSNLTSSAERDAAADTIRGVYEELSGDVIANATFMGLDSPWKRPFDRLNLDSQMVFVHPQHRIQRGQAVANMRNLWFTPTYQGVVVRSDSNAHGFKIERGGYQLGWDKRVAQNASVGLMLGYSSPTLHQNKDIVEASDFQVGLYGGAMVGYFIEVKGYIGFGHQNYKSSRTVDLRAIDLTTQTGYATFDGDTFNFSLEVARPLFLGFAVLRPTLGLDSEHAFRYGFEESGDSVAMSFDRSSISRTRARFAFALETCTLERAIFSGRLGYSALLGGHDYAKTTAQFVGAYAAPQTIRSVAVGSSYFDAGVGCRVFLNQSKTLSLLGDYDASVANRWAEHRGVVGFQFVY